MRSPLFPAGDYRLVTPACTVWAITLIGVYASPTALMVLGGGMLTMLAALALAVRADVVAWPAVGVLVVVSGMAAATAAGLCLRLEVRAHHPLSHVDGKARVLLVVRDDPVAMGPAAIARVRVRVDVLAVSGSPVRTAGAQLSGAAADWSDLLPGQRVSVLVRVSPPRRGELLVARLSATTPPRLVGRPPPQQRWAGAVRTRLQEVSARALGPESAGLLPGLVLGDVSALDNRVRDEFRAAGLSHLTAVSGANVKMGYGREAGCPRVPARVQGQLRPG